MRKGQASKTAEYVCMGRALAHGVLVPERFQDPTASVLLPEQARREVEGERSLPAPQGLRQRMRQEYLKTQAMMMVARTVAIDDAIRAARSAQLVILGAGLDGRAWRMPELEKVSVFEVDHPDSQREKRDRAARLTPASCDIRFVPVDFEHDALDAALAAAGHDESRSTTWVWEGVVMYLSRADIEATLAVVQRRSAPGSQLLIVYHAPALILGVVSLFLRRIGEPLRSAFTPEQMRALLGRYGFEVSADRDLPSIGATLSAEIAGVARRVKHMRIVTAVTGSGRQDSPPRSPAGPAPPAW
jgi:methyltransferase (TIGR00027 family)